MVKLFGEYKLIDTQISTTNEYTKYHLIVKFKLSLRLDLDDRIWI